MTDENDLRELIRTHVRRLQLLQQQKARYGISVDPRIIIEIEDIEAEINQLQADLTEAVEVKVVHPPYLGMHYFDVVDAKHFFGREQLTTKLVSYLRKQHFLAVVGASGSGKSSVVRAGLIPALIRGQPLVDGTLPPEDSIRWPIHVITPTAHPLEALATSLTRDSESVTATTTLIDDLKNDKRSLHFYVLKLLQRTNLSSVNLLLLIDQFEELFTLCQDETERRLFIDNLLTAAGPETTGPTVAIITLRADFYHHCAQYDTLRAALSSHQEYIGPMKLEELRLAIEYPAKREGYEFEPGLVDLLLRDVGNEPGALPLLSHALLETWNNRHGHILTFESYYKSGGVQEAIAKTAENTYHNNLTSEQQGIARRIFLSVTELGEGTQDTRRRASFSELILRPEEVSIVESVLKTLADARLITTSEEAAEVAHEALIREWPTLRQWLEEDREGLRTQRRLAEVAKEWERHDKNEGYLYWGARLAEADEWAETHPKDLRELEQAFLQASRMRRDQEVQGAERQRRWIMLGLAAGLIVTFGLTVLYFLQWRQAEEQRQVALSRQLAAQALAHQDDQFDLALLLSLEANNRITDTVEIRSSLLAILEHTPRLKTFLRQHTDRVLSVAFSPDGHTIASAGSDSKIILWDVRTGQLLSSLLVEDKVEVNSVAFSPDGQMLASGDSRGKITLWNVATRQPLSPPLTAHTESVEAIVFSPDGHLLASGSRDNTIILWNVKEGNNPKQLGQPLVGHADDIRSVAFSPDGQILASGSWDETIILWDISNSGFPKNINQPLTGHTGGVNSVAFSPDGQTLASGSEDRSIILWNVMTGQPIGSPLKMHKAPVQNVAFNPESQILASASSDNSIILWNIATGQAVEQPLTGHSGPVRKIAFSPNGQILVSGSDDKNIVVWNMEKFSNRLGRLLNYNERFINSLAFSPDGKILASGEDDDRIILWNIADKNNPIQYGHPLIGHSDAVKSVAFSKDGDFLASGSADGSIVLWNALTYKRIGLPLVGHTSGVECVTFSPDGQILASGSQDKTVRLWNAATHQPIGSFLAGHTGSVWSVTFSPDGQTIASGGQDGDIILWDIRDKENAKQLGQPLKGHINDVESIAFSPDGQILASAGWDEKVILWDVKKRNNPQQLSQLTLDNIDDLKSLAFNSDGQTLALGSRNGRIILLDVKDKNHPKPLGQQIVAHEAAVESIIFSPNGQMLASGGRDGTILLWDVANKDRLKQIGQSLTGPPITGHSGWINSVAFSSDGQTLASGSGDHGIILWNMQSRQPFGSLLHGHKRGVWRVAFSPDAHTLASGSDDDTIILWDVTDKKQPKQLGQPIVGHKGAVSSIAFNPDGHILASGSADNSIILWDVMDRNRPTQLGQPLSGHNTAVSSVTFSPNGRMLASGSRDNTIILWDIEDKNNPKPLGQPLAGHSDDIESVVFSPDGEMLASGSRDGKIILWNVDTHQPIGQPFTGHTSWVLSVAFSPDGHILASGSADNTIILWDVATHQPLGLPLTGHTEDILSLTFSPDGQVLASGSRDEKIILWPVSSKMWQTLACRIANRSLSQIEWNEYVGYEPYHETCPDLLFNSGVESPEIPPTVGLIQEIATLPTNVVTPTYTPTSTSIPTPTSQPPTPAPLPSNTSTSTSTPSVTPTFRPTPESAPPPNSAGGDSGGTGGGSGGGVQPEDTSTPTLTLSPSPTAPQPPAVPTGQFTLLKPGPGDEPSLGPTEFEWQWDGGLGPNQGFEIRVWRESEIQVGVHDSVMDNKEGRIIALGNNTYGLEVNIRDAFGVRGRSGEYLWTVALVQIIPEYKDLGIQATPGYLRFEESGGGGGGGQNGGSGGIP